jgi:hypothetical protein
VPVFAPPERRQGATLTDRPVSALARATGRGPAKARTTLGDNGVFVVLQDSLTRGEQTLADAGEGAAPLLGHPRQVRLGTEKRPRLGGVFCSRVGIDTGSPEAPHLHDP